MRPATDPTVTAPTSDPTAFDVWFGRMLRDTYEPVVHESLPSRLLELLPTERDD